MQRISGPCRTRVHYRSVVRTFRKRPFPWLRQASRLSVRPPFDVEVLVRVHGLSSPRRLPFVVHLAEALLDVTVHFRVHFARKVDRLMRLGVVRRVENRVSVVFVREVLVDIEVHGNVPLRVRILVVRQIVSVRVRRAAGYVHRRDVVRNRHVHARAARQGSVVYEPNFPVFLHVGEPHVA